jgi:hypothetical protein
MRELACRAVRSEQRDAHSLAGVFLDRIRASISIEVRADNAKGTAHEAGWLQIDGSLLPDGVAYLYVEGLVGAAPFAVGQRPAGTPYGYHVEARFSVDKAEGHRVEGRP